ncbi:uncharacterized protein EV420DRAFT_1223745, partial [Desarmillaria tabescens]
DKRPFVKIRVPDGTGEREVIAGPAITTPRSIPGRAISGLPAYDVETNSLRFLEDIWRDGNLPREPEIFNKAGVHNVPTFVCGGVVPDQMTIS